MSDNIKEGDVLEIVSLGSPKSFIGDRVIFIKSDGWGIEDRELYKVRSLKTRKIYNIFKHRFKKIGESNPNNKIIVI